MLAIDVEAPPDQQIPGDCNRDAVLDLSDAVCIFGILFTGRPSLFPCGNGLPDDPGNVALLDMQPDGVIDLSDGVRILQFLFAVGPPHPLAVTGNERRGCVSIPVCLAGAPTEAPCYRAVIPPRTARMW